MDFIGLFEIIVCVAIIILLTPYIEFVINLITTFLPSQILPFILLAIAISVIHYISSRKDD